VLALACCSLATSDRKSTDMTQEILLLKFLLDPQPAHDFLRSLLLLFWMFSFLYDISFDESGWLAGWLI